MLGKTHDGSVGCGPDGTASITRHPSTEGPDGILAAKTDLRT
jgi:hypothetical protein